MPPTDQMLALLAEIRDRLDALPARIAAAIAAQSRPPRRLAPADRAALAALLPAIHQSLAGRDFVVRDLIERAADADAGAGALRAALAPIGSDPRQIGKLLSRGVGCEVAGFRTIAIGPSRDGVLWAVRPV